MGLSLEELKEVTIVSASKKPEQQFLSAVPSFVLTGEEIRRSGAMSIPEALRLVPGLMVARNNSDTWSISSRGRGYDSVYDNKLLVLIDGRNQGSMFYKGTNWALIDPILADIDRIEVIRGPGTSVWGSNAINGVVNIITKSAGETQGVHASGTLGSLDKASGEMRYGGKVDATAFRLSGKYSTSGPLKQSSGDSANDQDQVGHVSLRVDTDPDRKVRNLFEASVQPSATGKGFMYPSWGTRTNVMSDYYGHDLDSFALFRQTRELSATSTLSWQAWASHKYSDSVNGRSSLEQGSLDIQQTFSPHENHQAQWALNFHPEYTSQKPSVPRGAMAAYDGLDYLCSAFVEDSVSLFDSKLRIILGLKAEYQGSNTVEFMPSFRALYNPVENHAFWAGVSRAVRRISLEEQRVDYDQSVRDISGLGVPFVVHIGSLGDIVPESVIAYEAGYRYRGENSLSLDVNGFYKIYQNLASGYMAGISPVLTPAGPAVQMTVLTSNDMEMGAYGVEANASLRPFAWLKLSGWYMYFAESFRKKGTRPDLIGQSYGGMSPKHQFTAQASFDLPRDFEFDAWLRFVDTLPAVRIPAYTELNLRLGWKPTRNLRVDLMGQNLLHDGHLEGVSQMFSDTRRVEIPRNVSLKLTYSF